MKTEEECKHYDNLKHFRADDRQESGDTYAHANYEDNNNTYAHTQRGQYFHTGSYSQAHNVKSDGIYEHIKDVECDENDTYDHPHLTVIETNADSGDYAYAHAQGSAVYESDYNNAWCSDRNDDNTYE